MLFLMVSLPPTIRALEVGRSPQEEGEGGGGGWGLEVPAGGAA